jgi:5-methylcytosine-specific restriction endonuclease McrA
MSEERDRQRSTFNVWRAWCKTARWQKLRAKVLKRDLYTCQRTGVLLTGKYPAPNSPVVDHKKAHRGDEALFWDETNMHAVSKAYHDKVKQAEEQSQIKGVWY